MYVDLNELRIQRECLCSAKKGHPAPFPPRYSPLLSPLRLSLYLRSALSSLLANPFACPPITHRYKDHTVRSHRRHHFDCHLSPPSPVCGGPAEWSFPCRSRCVHFPSLPFSTATVLLFFNMWGTGGFQWFYLSFLFLRWEGGYVRAAFPHLGLTKHTPCRPVPPLSLSVSHTPPLLSLLPRLSLFVCTVWTIVLVNNYYSTPPSPPPPQVGKYNSIFLCALGNLYNSILNLNETIKKHVEKTAQERHSWRKTSTISVR